MLVEGFECKGGRVTFIPIKNYILMEKEGNEEKSEGGLFLPQVEKTELNVGKVVAVGPDARRDIRVGEKIFYLPQTSFNVGTQVVTDLDSVLGKKGE
jgi:co-chaperonin GroES (HSP10)